MAGERHVQKQSRFGELADRAEERLQAARQIADRCRSDEALHRTAMKAVFVLEDTFFALRQIAEANDRSDGKQAMGTARYSERD